MLHKLPTANMRYVVLLLCLGTLAASGAITPTPLALPGGDGGIGFDDMVFAPSLHKVLVPAGRSGNLDLIDPDTKQVTAIGGFSSRTSFGGGHGQGVTSRTGVVDFCSRRIGTRGSSRWSIQRHSP